MYFHYLDSMNIFVSNSILIVMIFFPDSARQSWSSPARITTQRRLCRLCHWHCTRSCTIFKNHHTHRERRQNLDLHLKPNYTQTTVCALLFLILIVYTIQHNFLIPKQAHFVILVTVSQNYELHPKCNRVVIVRVYCEMFITRLLRELDFDWLMVVSVYSAVSRFDWLVSKVTCTTRSVQSNARNTHSILGAILFELYLYIMLLL